MTDSTGSAPLSPWALHRFVSRAGIKYAIGGLDLFRYAEYPVAMALLSAGLGCRVLEIGSRTSPLAAWMALDGCTVVATDLDDESVSRQRVLQGRLRLGAASDRLSTERRDARALGLPESSFDRAVAVSVVEHIPDFGDVDAARELARVLRMGGRAVIAVPFGMRYREAAPPFGDAAHHRVYSSAALRERLIVPGGFDLIAERYIESRGDSERRLWRRIPWQVTRAVGWMGPTLAAAMFRVTSVPTRLSCGVVLALRKGGDPCE